MIDRLNQLFQQLKAAVGSERQRIEAEIQDLFARIEVEMGAYHH